MKKDIVNIKNEDMLCFLYCIIAYLHPLSQNTHGVNNYKKYPHKINYEVIKMPMAVKDIDKFERMNNLIINVYACSEDGCEIWPRRISNKRGEAINLLMLDNGKNCYHYVLIRNLDRLLWKSGDVSHSKKKSAHTVVMDLTKGT